MQKIGRIILLVVVLALPALTHADTVKLKSGQSVEGVVIKFGNEYRIKQADGTTRTVAERDVASVSKTSPPDTAAPASITPAALGSVAGEAEPTDPTEREAFKNALIFSQMRPPLNQWLQKREDETLKLLAKYPRSFLANFAVGYYVLNNVREHPVKPPGATTQWQADDLRKAGMLDTAINALKRATSLKPDSYEAWAELSTAYRLKWRAAESLDAASKSYQLHPSVETAAAVHRASNDASIVFERSKNAALQRQMDKAIAQLGTFNEQSVQDRFPLDEIQSLMPHPPQKVIGQLDVGEGFILTESGHIIAPKSLLEDDADVWVMVRYWFVKPATVVALDEANDLAMLKVDHSLPLPCLPLLTRDLSSVRNFEFQRYAWEATQSGWSTLTVRSEDRTLEHPEGFLKGMVSYSRMNPGVAAIATAVSGNNLQLIEAKTIQSFIDANKEKLGGSIPGGSLASRQTAPLSLFGDVTVLIWVTQKGSPSPADNPREMAAETGG
jgi:hypothetical protein